MVMQRCSVIIIEYGSYVSLDAKDNLVKEVRKLLDLNDDFEYNDGAMAMELLGHIWRRRVESICSSSACPRKLQEKFLSGPLTLKSVLILKRSTMKQH